MSDPFTPLLDVTSLNFEDYAQALDESATSRAADGSPVVAVGIPVFQSDDGPRSAVDQSETAPFTGQPTEPDPVLCERQGFSAKPGETLVMLSSSGAPATVYVGCGKRESLAADELRRAGAAFVRTAGRSGVAVFVLPSSLALALTSPTDGSSAQRRAAQSLSEGLVLGAYRFQTHKSDASGEGPDRVVVAGIGLDTDLLTAGIGRGISVARAVCAARDLVNEPPSSMTPRRLAEAVEELFATSEGDGSRSAVTMEVWDEGRIAAEHLGGLLGVARGSAEPPRLVRAEYVPANPGGTGQRVPHVVLVGKGITFDSGGLSLKTAEGMATMKTDMSGAATVLAAVAASADLGIPVRVTAIAPVTENMPGGRASKPGDVLVARDGQTIEVLNTDAEGRLVLADGLSLAAEMHPDAIVDLATLTGAAVVALGQRIAAVFGNDQEVVDRLTEASARAGEALWQLPLAEEYKAHIESDVADMKNIGRPGQAGSIVAALLLARFVKEVPWAHIDMAGPARSDDDAGLLAKGGTGFGVRTLLEFLEAFTTVSPVVA